MRSKRRFAAHVLIGLGFSLPMLAEDGALDPHFSGDGQLLVDFGIPPGSSEYARSIVARRDGGLIVAGEVYSNWPSVEVGVSQIDASGALDSTFGDAGRVHFVFDPSMNEPTTVAALEDPSAPGIIVVGYNPGVHRIGLARLTPAGMFDPEFGGPVPAGRATHPVVGGEAVSVSAAAIFGAGRILVAGSGFRTGGEGLDAFVARFLANGQPDTFFGVQGVTWVHYDRGGSDSDEAVALAVQEDGKIVVLLQVETDDGADDADTGIARLQADGDFDPTFGGSGDLEPGHALFQLTDLFQPTRDAPVGLAIQPDGRILFTGANSFSLSPSRCYFGRLLLSGATDPSLALEIFDLADESTHCRSIVPQSDEKLLLFGASADTCFAVRFLADGQTLDPTFGDAGIFEVDLSSPIADLSCGAATLSGGRLAMAASAEVDASQNDLYIARLTNALIFTDSFESGSRASWSSTF